MYEDAGSSAGGRKLDMCACMRQRNRIESNRNAAVKTKRKKGKNEKTKEVICSPVGQTSGLDLIPSNGSIPQLVPEQDFFLPGAQLVLPSAQQQPIQIPNTIPANTLQLRPLIHSQQQHHVQVTQNAPSTAGIGMTNMMLSQPSMSAVNNTALNYSMMNNNPSYNSSTTQRMLIKTPGRQLLILETENTENQKENNHCLVFN